MDIDNVAQDDVKALETMGFESNWNAYVLSFFHGSRDQAVDFLLEHHHRLLKISTAADTVTIDDIIALGFSANDITNAMVANDMSMEKSVQFLLLRKHLLDANPDAFAESPETDHADDPWATTTGTESRRASMLPPKTSSYGGRSFPIQFDLPLEVDPDIFFSHPEEVQLEQQALYHAELARKKSEPRPESSELTPFAEETPLFDEKTQIRTYWVHEAVVHRHPTLRLGIQLRGPPDWHLVVVELKRGEDGSIGPGEEAGLQVGDILLAVNNHQIRGLRDLSYLTTVTKQGPECLLRVARAQDEAVRARLVAQATSDATNTPERRKATQSKLAAIQPVSEEDIQERAERAERAAAAKAERKAARAAAAEQHRELVTWLRKTSPPAPASWKPCLLAMSTDNQKKLYHANDRHRRRHMAIAAGLYEVVTAKQAAKSSKRRGTALGVFEGTAQVAEIMQPAYRLDGLKYYEHVANATRATANELYDAYGHPFSGDYCLADELGKGAQTESPQNGKKGDLAAVNPVQLELPSSLTQMLHDMHATQRGTGSSPKGGNNDNAGDWKSKWGNFFKNMGKPNKNAEYAARLKVYWAMLHEYDNLLRGVHREIEARFNYLNSAAQDSTAKVWTSPLAHTPSCNLRLFYSAV